MKDCLLQAVKDDCSVSLFKELGIQSKDSDFMTLTKFWFFIEPFAVKFITSKPVMLNHCSEELLDMSLIMRKPVFGVFDQVRLKPACPATEAKQRFEISDIETRDIIISRQWTAKVLIRAGWSAPFLFAYD